MAKLLKFSRFSRLEDKFFLILLATAVASCIIVFAITRTLFYNLMVSDLLSRATTVNNYTQTIINPTSFYLIKSSDDNYSALYTSQQQRLNTIRRLAKLRYLYTINKSPSGHFVYLVDGVSKDSTGYSPIGERVEPDILPMVQQCYNGTPYTSRSISHTSWGPVYFACWPVKDNNHKVLGVLGMEFDSQELHAKNLEVSLFSIGISLIVAAVFLIISRYGLSSVSTEFYRKMAYADFLSGLQNRTAFELDLNALNKELTPSSRYTLVVYDLDNLKVVNDKLGHGLGDHYIKSMAKLLSGLSLSEGTVHYRIGGDEFTSIIPDMDCQEINEVLAAMQNSAIPSFGTDIPFAFSYGCSMYVPEQDETLREVLARADKKMYTQKMERKLTINSLGRTFVE